MGEKRFHPVIHRADRGLFQDHVRLLSNKLNGKPECIKTSPCIFTTVYKCVVLVVDI